MFSRLTFLAGLVLASLLSVQTARAADPLWRDIDESVMRQTAAARSTNVDSLRTVIPQSYRTLELNRAALRDVLADAPREFSGPIEAVGVEMTLPLPEGGFGRFSVQESPIMEPALAKKFPEIKTYVGQGIDDPTANIRIDVTPVGFHAIILSARGQVYIDPYWRDSDATYIAYKKSDYVADKPFSCVLKPNPDAAAQRPSTDAAAFDRPTGASLRTYRLALACTGEYAAAVSSPNAPSVSRALAAMITSANRVSAVYERELAVRLVLIGNTDKLIYLDGATDPYTNNDGSTMLGENQSNLNAVIGSANFDIGHVFSTGGGGVAFLGVPCTSAKAGGVTGLPNPTGDPYDIDFVAHEMGHQFGANHTFNSSLGGCGGGTRNASTAYEVGSGTTIMGYSGLCGISNLANHSDDYFHTASYTEIDDFTSSSPGNSCPVNTPTGNSPPVIDALPAGYTIPASTPFALTGNATDANGDTLTYAWEQFDLGPQQASRNPSSISTGPVFRSFPPTLSRTRYFPSLTYVLNNNNVAPATVDGTHASGEVLPSIARTMNFRLTVRDNRAGGGGANWGATTVTTVPTGAAFAVTAPNTAVSYPGGSQQTVTWNVAGTDANNINTTNVKITLSTDGGKTFPTVLAASALNTGSAVVTIPAIATTQGRIKVEAVGNIFFDISNANFTITSTNTAPTINVTNSFTIVRGTPTATTAVIGTASDANGDALTVSVSDLPYRANVTASIVGNDISLSGTADCGLVTTLTTRTYPITVTVADANGALTSTSVNLLIAPNPSPTLGAYPNISVDRGTAATAAPAAPAADSNNNIGPAPYSVTPTTLPGGGTILIDQSTGVVTATATAGSTLGATTVRVTALDSCGAAAVSSFNVNVISTTPVLQAGTTSGPSSESCSPANGVVDPGETVTVDLPITNLGTGATGNLTATLQNSGGVARITTSQDYGSIAGNSTTSRSFQFTASGACGGFVTATLQLQDGGINYGTLSYSIRLGAPTSAVTYAESFDGVTAPALPAGWSAVVASGTTSPWATNSTSPDTAPNSVSATTAAAEADNLLISPSISLPSASPQLSFRNRWNVESGFDGGILEISINGGVFTDIIAAGGAFVTGGYNGTISEGDGSPIAGAPAWTGNTAGAYITTVVNLPPQSAGQNVQFRWRLASDGGVSVTGAVWRIDTINVTANGFVCSDCLLAPQFTSAPPASPLTVGTPYSHTFVAAGNPPPTFSLTSGTLPPGLTLSPSGVLSGTPTDAGNGSFPNIVVTATNSVGSAQQSFSLTVVTSSTNYIASFGLTGADAAYNADPERDGIPNQLEYALRLNPTIASTAGLPVAMLKDYGGTKYLSLTFTRSSLATDISYIVEATGNLADPNSWVTLGSSVGGGPMTGAGVVSDVGPAPNFAVEVRDTTPANTTSNTKRFMRLKVTSP